MIGKGAIIGLAAIAVLAVAGMTCYGKSVAIKRQDVAFETNLTAQWQRNQNTLDTYVSGIREQLSIAGIKQEGMDTILRHAVSGTYGEGFGRGSPMMAALAVAYPDLKGLDIYDKIVEKAAAGREAFRNDQNVLLDQVRVYNAWRADGWFRAWVLENYAPTKYLQARVGGKVVATGPAALEMMSNIITSSETAKVYTEGKMDAVDFSKKK